MEVRYNSGHSSTRLAGVPGVGRERCHRSTVESYEERCARIDTFRGFGPISQTESLIGI